MKMLNSLLIIACFTCAVSVFGQANLPTSWDIETTVTPQGWTQNLAGQPFYTQACQGDTSLRFNNAGENIIIHTATQPGTISFLIRGMVGTADFWNGSFHIQESEDSLTWTSTDSISGPGSLNIDSCDLRTFAISNPLTRYIKLTFVNKFSGNDTINGGGNVNVDSIYVSGTEVTGTSNTPSENKGIIVFPNPSEDHLTIRSQTVIDRIKVINALGEVIYNQPANATTNYSLNLNGMAKGIYWIEVSGKGTRSVQKIIKN